METKNNIQEIKKLVALGVFAALAYVIHFVHIPVGFLNLDFKDVVIAVCGMYFGPLSGIVIAVVVPFLEFITVSSTGVYGLIMNILSSLTFVGVASLVYHFRKTLSGAVIGLCSAVLAMTAVMIAANLLITPYYMGVSTAEVAALIPKLLLPFNAIKAVLNASLTLCLYKPITSVLKRTGFKRGYNENSTNNTSEISKNDTKIRTFLVWIIGAGIAIISLCIIFFVLGGTVTIN